MDHEPSQQAQINPYNGKQKGIKDACKKCKRDVWWHQVQKPDSPHRGKWFYKCDPDKGGCNQFSGFQRTAPTPGDQSFHPASEQKATGDVAAPVAIPSPTNSAFTTYPRTTPQGDPALVAVQPSANLPQGSEAPRLLELVSGTVNSPATRNLSVQLSELSKDTATSLLRIANLIEKLNQAYVTNTEILLKVCETLKINPSYFGIELDLFHEWRSQKQKEQATKYTQDKMEEVEEAEAAEPQQNRPKGSTSPSS